jgi:hypothetical protein
MILNTGIWANLTIYRGLAALRPPNTISMMTLSFRDGFIAALGFFAVWSLVILNIGIHIGKKTLNQQTLFGEINKLTTAFDTFYKITEKPKKRNYKRRKTNGDEER